MPLLTAVTVVSGALWRLFGYNSHEDWRRRKIVAKTYDSEFLNYFDNILALLEGRKITTPRLKTAYDHLAEVRTTRVVHSNKELCRARIEGMEHSYRLARELATDPWANFFSTCSSSH